MSLFKKKEDKKEKPSAALTKEQFLDALNTQKRQHPILDRLMMIAGIIGLFIVSVPFIHVSWDMSIFGLFSGPFYSNGDGESVFAAIAGIENANGFSWFWDPIFQSSGEYGEWIFVLLGTIILISIIVALAFILIIYYRDLAAIIKAIIVYFRANSTYAAETVKESGKDAKSVLLVDKKAEDDKKEEKKEEVEEVKADSSVDSTVSSTGVDYNKLSDEELNALMTGKKRISDIEKQMKLKEAVKPAEPVVEAEKTTEVKK